MTKSAARPVRVLPTITFNCNMIPAPLRMRRGVWNACAVTYEDEAADDNVT
jgi:hypothetical protein